MADTEDTEVWWDSGDMDYGSTAEVTRYHCLTDADLAARDERIRADEREKLLAGVRCEDVVHGPGGVHERLNIPNEGAPVTVTWGRSDDSGDPGATHFLGTVGGLSEGEVERR